MRFLVKKVNSEVLRIGLLDIVTLYNDFIAKLDFKIKHCI